MKLSVSKDADPNYLAVVVTIPEIKPHPNGERLSVVEVFGNSIIIAKDMYKVGEKVVYFPVESCLKPEFLSWANLFDKPELNADEKSKGFFSSKGCRVKAVNLRSMPSQGFLYKTEQLAKYYKISDLDFKVGESFDTVGDHQLVTKYIRPESNNGQQNFKKSKIPAWINNTLGRFPRPIRRMVYPVAKWWYISDNQDGIKSKIVDGHFHFHYKTEQFGRNLFILKPEDDITISQKLHGTSSVYSMCKCYKPWSLTRWVINHLGGHISDTEYKLVYTSRSTYKNRKDEKYTEDVWGDHAKILADLVTYQNSQGYNFYGEIVGWTSGGKCIQKNYDYSVPRGKSELYIYRVTYNSLTGEVWDLSWDAIEMACRVRGLKTVPVCYNGIAKDLFPDIPVDENWSQRFMGALKEKYLDKTCDLCTTGVVNEGIVIKFNDKPGCPAFKFKSPAFLIKESSDRDKGEIDMEEES